MKIKIDKSFEKDTNKIDNKDLLNKIALCIESVISAKTIDEVLQLKKLSGFKNHFRIRIGDYRIGVVLQNDEVVFERILHRKDIYKYYP